MQTGIREEPVAPTVRPSMGLEAFYLGKMKRTSSLEGKNPVYSFGTESKTDQR